MPKKQTIGSQEAKWSQIFPQEAKMELFKNKKNFLAFPPPCFFFVISGQTKSAKMWVNKIKIGNMKILED